MPNAQCQGTACLGTVGGKDQPASHNSLLSDVQTADSNERIKALAARAMWRWGLRAGSPAAPAAGRRCLSTCRGPAAALEQARPLQLLRPSLTSSAPLSSAAAAGGPRVPPAAQPSASAAASWHQPCQELRRWGAAPHPPGLQGFSAAQNPSSDCSGLAESPAPAPQLRALCQPTAQHFPPLCFCRGTFTSGAEGEQR